MPFLKENNSKSTLAQELFSDLPLFCGYNPLHILLLIYYYIFKFLGYLCTKYVMTAVVVENGIETFNTFGVFVSDDYYIGNSKCISPHSHFMYFVLMVQQLLLFDT